MVFKIIAVMLGGGLGALARFGSSSLCGKLFGTGFPYGTLAVNMIGCFLIGIFFTLTENHFINPNMKLFIMTGFLGAFTTFSTFALDNAILGQNAMLSSEILNIAIQNIGGIILVLSGMWIAKLI